MTVKRPRNFKPAHVNFGLSLVHVLLIVSVMSVMSVILASRQQVDNGERMAAVTISRVHSLLDMIYTSGKLSSDTERWSVFCNSEDPFADIALDGWKDINGFGYQFKTDNNNCSSRVFRIYYYVPQRWSGYIQNHLESTVEVAALDVPRSVFVNYNRAHANGLVLLQTSVDLYGNLKNGSSFVRKEFITTVTGLSSSITSVEIPKPECTRGIPKIHYSVSGICSHYPIEVEDPYGESIQTNESGLSGGETNNYNTYGFEYRLTGACTSTTCDRDEPWRIALYANEHWNTVSEHASRNGSLLTVDQELTVVSSPSAESCVSSDDAKNIVKIRQLMEANGYQYKYWLVFQRLDMTRFLYDLGLFTPQNDFRHRLYYRIRGHAYGRVALAKMYIKEFEDTFGVSFSSSEYKGIQPKLTVDAWVSCAAAN